MNLFLKSICMAITILCSSVSAHAQFNAILLNFTPLTDFCDVTGTPFGAGCFATIYWDQNNNGPDGSDQPVAVGNGFGQANFNQIDMASGEELLGIPGGFATDPAFTISTNTPLPSRYYVLVECQAARWTSAVITILDGLNEYDMSNGWQCRTENLCDEPRYIFHEVTPDDWNGEPQSECIYFCPYEPVVVCFGPLSEDESPHVLFIPGCQHGANGCNSACHPAEVIYNPIGWVYLPAMAKWCAQIVSNTHGCACMIEEWLPVEYASFTAQPRDGANFIVWSTASELDVDFFRLSRDGQFVHTIGGSNTSVGATYSFMDENLVNGRLYTYSLEVVNLDGTIEAWPNVANATPSVNNAVVTEYALHQNYPNPFNPNTNFVFDVVEQNIVSLRVFNVQGELVAEPTNNVYSSGRYTVAFDASALATGLYFYTIKIGTVFTATKKMLLIK